MCLVLDGDDFAIGVDSLMTDRDVSIQIEDLQLLEPNGGVSLIEASMVTSSNPVDGGENIGVVPWSTVPQYVSGNSPHVPGTTVFPLVKANRGAVPYLLLRIRPGKEGVSGYSGLRVTYNIAGISYTVDDDIKVSFRQTCLSSPTAGAPSASLPRLATPTAA